MRRFLCGREADFSGGPSGPGVFLVERLLVTGSLAVCADLGALCFSRNASVLCKCHTKLSPFSPGSPCWPSHRCCNNPSRPWAAPRCESGVSRTRLGAEAWGRVPFFAFSSCPGPPVVLSCRPPPWPSERCLGHQSSPAAQTPSASLLRGRMFTSGAHGTNQAALPPQVLA